MGHSILPDAELPAGKRHSTHVELSREIAAGIPSARLVVSDERGHGATLEQPAVNRQLMNRISDPA